MRTKPAVQTRLQTAIGGNPEDLDLDSASTFPLLAQREEKRKTRRKRKSRTEQAKKRHPDLVVVDF